MTHTCQFCKTEVPYSKSVGSCDFYICPKCPENIYVVYTYLINNPTPIPMYIGYSLVVNLNGDTYHMDFMANETHPFVLHKFKENKDPIARNQRVMELTYAPNITPETATPWLEKLLNLKVFS